MMKNPLAEIPLKLAKNDNRGANFWKKNFDLFLFLSAYNQSWALAVILNIDIRKYSILKFSIN